MRTTVPKDNQTPVDNDGTVRLSPHARQRCAEMGLPTKRIKRGMRAPQASYPTPYGRTITLIDDTVAVVHVDGVVVTVLWNGEFVRGDAPARPSGATE
jgi:hypothetical protein